MWLLLPYWIYHCQPLSLARVRTRDFRRPYSVGKDEDPSENEIKPVIASQVIPAIKEVKPRHQAIEEQHTDAKSVARNRRMLGMILGTLQRFQSEETQRKPVVRMSHLKYFAFSIANGVLFIFPDLEEGRDRKKT